MAHSCTWIWKQNKSINFNIHLEKSVRNAINEIIIKIPFFVKILDIKGGIKEFYRKAFFSSSFIALHKDEIIKNKMDSRIEIGNDPARERKEHNMGIESRQREIWVGKRIIIKKKERSKDGRDRNFHSDFIRLPT